MYYDTGHTAHRPMLSEIKNDQCKRGSKIGENKMFWMI